jgi:hypothetical protein
MSITRSTPRRALASSILLVLLSTGLLTTGLMRSADAKPQGNDGDVALNAANSEFSPTSVTNISNSGGYGFGGTATADPNGIGLVGNGSSAGVSGTGVGAGVTGTASGSGGSGVLGTGEVGVNGNSTWGTGVNGKGGRFGLRGDGDTGVYGTGNVGVDAVGGTSGVQAKGWYSGVEGNGSIIGVYGSSETGLGVQLGQQQRRVRRIGQRLGQRRVRPERRQRVRGGGPVGQWHRHVCVQPERLRAAGAWKAPSEPSGGHDDPGVQKLRAGDAVGPERELCDRDPAGSHQQGVGGGSRGGLVNPVHHLPQQSSGLRRSGRLVRSELGRDSPCLTSEGDGPCEHAEPPYAPSEPSCRCS